MQAGGRRAAGGRHATATGRVRLGWLGLFTPGDDDSMDDESFLPRPQAMIVVCVQIRIGHVVIRGLEYGAWAQHAGLDLQTFYSSRAVCAHGRFWLHGVEAQHSAL